MTREATGYKSKYDHPNAFGKFLCIMCQKKSKLPANYCKNCGKELEEYQKKGLRVGS